MPATEMERSGIEVEHCGVVPKGMYEAGPIRRCAVPAHKKFAIRLIS